MQEQQQGQSLNVWQRIHAAIQLNKMLNRTRGTDFTAFQTEDAMVKIFEHLNVSASAIEIFKERLEKRRQAISLTYIGDTYIMGGILIYCGILLPVLVSLGTSDSSTRLAWIAFAVSLPCTVGFFLVRFLKKKNNISNYGVIHGGLAALAQIGIVVATAGLFFHVWNVVGWIFLLSALMIFIVYGYYLVGIYSGPFYSILTDVFKEINKTSPLGKEQVK